MKISSIKSSLFYNKLIFTVDAVGATAYHLTLVKGNQEIQSLGWVATNIATFTLTTPGEYRLQVKLRDTYGRESKWARGPKVKVTQLTTPPAAEPSTPSTPTSDEAEKLLAQALPLLEKAVALLEKR